MQFTALKIFLFVFKLSCVIVVVLMSSYWLIKFENDADVSLVDYKLFKDVGDIAFPEASICFENPVVNQKLKEIDPRINSTTYINYLKGDVFEERLRIIETLEDCPILETLLQRWRYL